MNAQDRLAEGMLLRPQHLQHNDRYYDNQMKARTSCWAATTGASSPWSWTASSSNMGKLVISQALRRIARRQPVRTRRQHRASPSTCRPIPRTCRSTWPLPGHRNHIEARRPEQAEVLARYTAYDLEVADSNAGEDSMVQVSCARPDFRLLLGEQPERPGLRSN